MKTLILAAIRCSLMFTAVTSLVCVQPAQAYTVTLQQIGSNVVANGSGAINLTGLTLSFPSAFSGAVVFASVGQIETGPASALVDGYTGFAGPTSFGSGGLFFPNTGSGDFVGLDATGVPFIAVPQGYVSGAALSDSMTFNNATLASLGVTPGTYVWTWGDGANQRFTLRIGTVPDGGSTVSLLGCALLGLAAFRRKLSC
jgi:VPDSG-CTERM motif